MNKEAIMKKAFPNWYEHSLIVFARFFHKKKNSASLDIKDLPFEISREKERMLFYKVPEEIADKAIAYLIEEAEALAKEQGTQ